MSDRAVSSATKGFPLDFAVPRHRRRPDDRLAAPEGAAIRATPDLTVPDFSVDPAALADAVRAVALSEPRTELPCEDGDACRMEFRQRSRLFGFPDLVTVQVEPRGHGGSSLFVWSRARYGIRDFGVNRARMRRWLTALAARLAG